MTRLIYFPDDMLKNLRFLTVVHASNYKVNLEIYKFVNAYRINESVKSITSLKSLHMNLHVYLEDKNII